MTRRVWFTADIHLAHPNVLHLSNRPFKNIEEMRRVILQNINLRVKEEDVLYLLGDVSLGDKRSWVDFLEELKCKNIILVKGNHDKYGTIPKDKVLAVIEQCTIRLMGRTLLLCHHPYRITVMRLLRSIRNIRSLRHLMSLFSKVRPVDRGLWLIHGHTHATTKTVPYHNRMLNVGVDAHNFCPVSGDEIIRLIQIQESCVREIKA